MKPPALLLLVPAALLTGIDGCPPSSEDADGDGWTTDAGDCDDTAAHVYPGAPDACGDTVDADCDGADPTCPVQGGDWDPADFLSVYDVGPGQPYADPGEVPWEALEPSSLVRIHWREEPYRSKWVINTVATEDAPVVVTGVPEDGQMPVITGEDAVTRLELEYWNEDRSVIKVGGSDLPAPDLVPSYVYIEMLDIRSARTSYTFTDDAGKAQTYSKNAAAIHIEVGDHITLRGCQLHDAGNGLMASPQSSSLLVSSNHLYDNGNVGSAYEHNSYTESIGITFEYNLYGHLCDGCDGNNLKDRSAGTVIRYNWIEGGNRQLDLVDSTEAEADDPRYLTTYVYGNVLLETPDEGNSQIIHYGGDSGDTSTYRNGTLYLYGNTIVSTRTDNTTLIRLSSDGQHVDARSNIVRATAGGSALALLTGDGTVDLEANWLEEDWVVTHDGDSSGTVNDLGNVEGIDPGFADEQTRDYHLAGGSSCIDAGIALADEASSYPLTRQYVPHQGGEDRIDAGVPDIGGYAY